MARLLVGIVECEVTPLTVVKGMQFYTIGSNLRDDSSKSPQTGEDYTKVFGGSKDV